MSWVSVDKTVWLCPDPWKAPAIDQSSSLAPISVDSDDDTQICDVTVRLIPEGRPTGENDEVQVSIIRTTDNPIACLICREEKRRRTDDYKKIGLLDRINKIRLSAPAECGSNGCPPLILDDRLIAAANAYGIDLANGTAYAPELYANFAGAAFFNFAVVSGFIAKPTQTISIKPEDLDVLLDDWMAGGKPERSNLLLPMFSRMGLSFLFTFKPLNDPGRGWRVVAFLADLDPQYLEDDLFQDEPPQGWKCNFACVRDIRYYRKKIVEDPLHPEQNILSDYITFSWRTPALCNLYRIELHGDVRGTRYIIPCDIGACKGEAPDSKSLALILGGKELEFDMLDIEPYPGERFEVWGHLQGVASDCSPTLIAAGYFKHFCHTSGVITRIVLLNDQGQVIDQRTSGSTPDDWIGKENLRYEVLVEGALLIVISSDFARYNVGERVAIQKGGSHTELTPVGLVHESGCKDPKDGTLKNQFLRSTIVRPIWKYGGTVRTDGVILPQDFWGI